MKKFNQVINVQVSVDSIAESFLSTISMDEKHRELIAEAVIGSALEKGTLSYIHNALNGYSNSINFEVGDTVSFERYYRKNKEQQERKEHTIQATVVDVNPYSDLKVKLHLEYEEYSYGEQNKVNQDEWVSHLKCSKIPVKEE